MTGSRCAGACSTSSSSCGPSGTGPGSGSLPSRAASCPPPRTRRRRRWGISTPPSANGRGQLDETPDESLGELIGPVAGRYGDATRRAFALHIIDELVHHTAEAALLRDLHAGQRGE